ncbi:MAG: Uma2 family endonuclease [Bacteroidota bacterium]
MQEINDLSQLDLSKNYTYADYLEWRLKERVELIKGKIHTMSPAPKRMHQKISLKFTLSIGNQLRNSSCELYEAPFDVRFVKEGESNEKIVNVV